MIKKVRFENLPWVFRQSAVAALGWRNRFQRFGTEYSQWTKFLHDSNDWSLNERSDWQRRKLLSLLKLAQTGTEHYAAVLPHLDELESLESLDALLHRIPVLEKESLRKHPNSFRNQHVKEALVTSTSGSTGSPMRFGHDSLSIQRRFAFMHDHLRMAGVATEDPKVRLSGRILCTVGEYQRRPWLYNPAEKQLFLSSYHLDAAHASIIAKRITKMAPTLMDGYPSGVLEVLRLLKKEKSALHSLKAIITTAETLHPDMRMELEDLSGVPVMDYYAASEGVPFIQQCRFGTYHVRWQSGLFEVDNGEHVGLDGSGELVCTSFVQDRTPLIRYRTGDLVQGMRQLPATPCACGLNTPTVESVLGRVEDMIRTRDGRALGMFTYRTLKHIDGLRETQVIQHDYADFEVNGTIREGFDALELQEMIRASFERALGYPITLRFNLVDQIPRGANGKVRLVISKIPRHRA